MDLFNAMGTFIGNLLQAPLICLGWVIVGILAGMLARAVTGGKQRNSCADLVLGLGGAIIGGFLAGLFNVNLPGGGLNLVVANLIVATVGAVVLIFIGRVIFRMRSA